MLQVSKLRLREVELLAQELNGKARLPSPSLLFSDRVTVLGPQFPPLRTKKPRDPPVPKGLGSLS